MLMEVSSYSGASDAALVHPDVEAVCSGHRTYGSHRFLGEVGKLRRLSCGEVGGVGAVAVWAHHEVAGVVRVQIQHGIDLRATRHDEAILVREPDDPAERAVVGIG